MSEHRLDRRAFLAAASGVAAGLAGCSLTTETRQSPTEGSTAGTPTSGALAAGDAQSTPERTAVPETDRQSTTAPTRYAEVYREAIDSVVMVQTGGGQGTGFVFDSGHVVTNAHVVGSASAATVRFEDGQWSDGDVVGTDPHADLAAVAVDDRPSAATPLPFADGEPVVGQEVVAIGNPYSLNGSLTTGVVSGTDRLIPGPTGYRIPDAVQTDAAVNPGNSGGPLMSLDGRVVAVINSGGGDNIAFGISAALTQRVVPELIANGDYTHSYTGTSVTAVTPTIAAANDLEKSRGLIVVDVATDGPADGTLRPSEVRFQNGQQIPVGGDVLLAVDGTDLQTTEDLWSYLALEASPGQTVELTVLRDGEQRTVSLELGTRPERRR